MIRSSSHLQRKSFQNTAQPQGVSPFDFAMGMESIRKIADELNALKHEHEAHIEKASKNAEYSVQVVQKANELLDQLYEHVASTVKKGEQGEPGKDGKDADHNAIVDDVLKRIRQPKDGKDAVINEDSIVKKVISLIPKPKDGKRGKDAIIDEDSIAEKVASHFVEGKKKLPTKSIDGWQDAHEVVRRFIANGSIRGGGDIVAAGSGITITTSNGVKTITSSAGATIYTETPSGLVNGSNKAYTTAHSITTVLGMWINGQFIHPSEYTVSGAGFTMTTALDASLSGTGFTITYN